MIVSQSSRVILYSALLYHYPNGQKLQVSSQPRSTQGCSTFLVTVFQVGSQTLWFSLRLTAPPESTRSQVRAFKIHDGRAVGSTAIPSHRKKYVYLIHRIPTMSWTAALFFKVRCVLTRKFPKSLFLPQPRLYCVLEWRSFLDSLQVVM